MRPLLAGNVSLSAFLVVLATRYFNFLQALRGGSTYPPMPPAGVAYDGSHAIVAPGDMVTVRSVAEIAATLNSQNKHRGLWFDRDMVKHCGRTYRVLKRVDRIIDDATGQMRLMKTPCIVLEGVDYSGEYLNFSAQHEYLYWREHWLKPVSH